MKNGVARGQSVPAAQSVHSGRMVVSTILLEVPFARTLMKSVQSLNSCGVAQKFLKCTIVSIHSKGVNNGHRRTRSR